MVGAILGDIVGSRFEWHNCKSKDFEFLTPECQPTDDSMMTIAIANAIVHWRRDGGDLSSLAILEMQRIGRTYLNIGYGPTFARWIWLQHPHPYNSWGNGAAMRVSPCGFAAKSLEEALKMSEAVTKVTHNHPEGLKGAAATTAAIYLARTGHGKDEIRDYIERNYYSLDFTIDQIRRFYEFDVSCQGSVPPAIEAFLESDGYIDAIRNAVSIGGDSDTIAAITGGIAEAYYGLPDNYMEKVLERLDQPLISDIRRFRELVQADKMENGEAH